jgi:hypothetical protein
VLISNHWLDQNQGPEELERILAQFHKSAPDLGLKMKVRVCIHLSITVPVSSGKHNIN